ncbi:MAG: T9SS type A sorting domain-containing protein [Bacteroidota bacterium]
MKKNIFCKIFLPVVWLGSTCFLSVISFGQDSDFTVHMYDASSAGAEDGLIRIISHPRAGAGPFTYEWADQNGNRRSWTSNEINNLSPGKYCVTISDGCCDAKGCYCIMYPDMIQLNSIKWTDSPTEQRMIDITVCSDHGPLTYQWSCSNGYTSTAEDPDNIPGFGSYSVVVTDANGCTLEKTVDLTEEIISDGFFITDVFPNPFKDEINIVLQSGSEGMVNMELVSVFGRKVLAEKAMAIQGQQTVRINTRHVLMPDGLYLLQVENREGFKASVKILKQGNR